MKLSSNSLNVGFRIVKSKEKDVDDFIGGGASASNGDLMRFSISVLHCRQQSTLAMEKLNNTPLYGKLIPVVWSRRDPAAGRSGVGNVFVNNLDESIDYVGLYNKFSLYGKIMSYKVAMNSEGTSKGFGFVQFEVEESSKQAIAELHGTTVAGKKIGTMTIMTVPNKL